jgi:hypothetical protein
VHASLGRLGDATLECWLGRRVRLNGWVAHFVHVDFTLLCSMPAVVKEGDDVRAWKSKMHRYGSLDCVRSGLSFAAQPGCMHGRDGAYLPAFQDAGLTRGGGGGGRSAARVPAGSRVTALS